MALRRWFALVFHLSVEGNHNATVRGNQSVASVHSRWAAECPNMQKHTRMNLPRLRRCLISSALLSGLYGIAGQCAAAPAQSHRKPTAPTMSPTFGHQAWTTENGLPQNSVHQVLQTRDGYLWIATEGGVARFNGTQFAAFNRENNDAFSSNDACCLAQDRSGTLWIGTADGLLRYAGGTFHRYTTAEGLLSSSILSLTPAEDGSLLVLTGGGLKNMTAKIHITSCFRVRTGLRTREPRVGGHRRRSPFIQCRSSTPPVTAITSGGANRGTGLPERRLAMDTNAHRSSVVDSQRASLLAHRSRVARNTSAVIPRGLAQQSLGRHGRGLVMLPPSTEAGETRLEMQPLIGAASILALFEDREHDLWVGTDTAGLQILRPQKFHAIASLSGYPITAITQTSDGSAWLGSKGEGLFRNEHGNTSELSIKDGSK